MVQCGTIWLTLQYSGIFQFRWTPYKGKLLCICLYVTCVGLIVSFWLFLCGYWNTIGRTFSLIYVLSILTLVTAVIEILDSVYHLRLKKKRMFQRLFPHPSSGGMERQEFTLVGPLHWASLKFFVVQTGISCFHWTHYSSILIYWFECAVGGHPQHTQTSSNSSTIAAGSSNGLTNARCCRYSCLRSWWWVQVPPETCWAVSR